MVPAADLILVWYDMDDVDDMGGDDEDYRNRPGS